MPLSSTQRTLVAKFMATTNASEKIALRYLKSANYKLDIAADAFFSSSNSHGGSTSTSQRADAALEKMFDNLRDPERDPDKNEIGAETIESYTKSLGVNLENYELFVLLEIIKAEGMGKVTRKGFVGGWKEVGSPSSAAAQKSHVRASVGKLSTSPSYFRQVYRSAFVTGKEAEKRSLDLDVAIVFWDMLFHPTVYAWQTGDIDWLATWKRFLADKWTRSVNKDMWNQTLEFANKIKDYGSLAFWSEDAAWPGVMDDFVVWCREQGIGFDAQAGEGDGMEMDE